jgi:two-component system sensor histidine kinase RegB
MVNIEDLLRLRWLWLGCQLALVLSAGPLTGWHLPLGWLLALVAAGAVSNAAAVLRRPQARAGHVLGGLFLLDTALLTGMLGLAGGAHNPFSSLFLLYVAMGASVLSGGWTWALVAGCAAGYSSLYLLDIAPDVHGGGHADPMRLHLVGMWVAFLVVGPAVALAIGQLRRSLAESQRRLEEARSRAARRERLASLGTLAAGAAHELATPLGTIALAAGELERRGGAAVARDAAIIRQEVGRCNLVLRRLAADVGAGVGEPPETLALGDWVDRAIERLDGQQRLERRAVLAPPRLLSQALEGLLKNALYASPPDAVVRLALREVEVDDGAGGGVAVEVSDRGAGMDPQTLERAGEPFFTTKPEGEGTGLGLFFARSVVEPLGGTLELSSAAGEGTRAVLTLPLTRE